MYGKLIVLLFLVALESGISEDPCGMDKEVGPCRASMPRYYYNKSAKCCERFTYGGCQGNANNFLTKEECEAMCMPESTK